MGGISGCVVVPPGVGLFFLVKPSMTCRMPLIQMASILSFSVAAVLGPMRRLRADMTMASAFGFRAFLRFSTKPVLRPTTAVRRRGSMTGLGGALAGGVAEVAEGRDPEAAAGCDVGAGP